MGIVLIVAAALLLGCVLWVGVRTLMAVGELGAAVPLASRAQDAILAGDVSAAGSTISDLARHAESAASLTSDPVFATSELIPVVGPNLAAFRQIAAAIDDVASDGLSPLAALAGSVDAGSLTPIDGTIELQPIIDAAPALEASELAMLRASADVADIDTTGTIGPVTDAVGRLSAVVEDAASAVAAASRTAQLLPSMLGAKEDRTYLLIFQNNAEVRASGGLPGALAVVATSGGHFEMTTQASANDFPYYDEPVLPIDYATESLYGSNVARYMQNVNLTPDFPTSARLASEMWRRQFGVEVDGVIAVDPVLLGYILKASGPVTLSTGEVIDSTNAVDFLLSGVYAKYPDTTVQDLVFADAARAVFGTLATGNLDPAALITALTRGAEERRILIWNSREAEQELLAGTDFAGILPATNDDGNVVGIYLNDATGAKMDYYLEAEAMASVGTCEADAGPMYRTEIALTSTAPADGGTSLPAYVTGAGAFGVPPGTFRTRVVVYGPVDSAVISATVDGGEADVQTEKHLGRAVAQVIVDLAPGETATVSVDMLGAETADTTTSVQMTPLVRAHNVKILSLTCG